MTITDQLKNIVGSDHVLSAASVAERATHFWDPSPMVAMALVRPANTREVSEVLKICHQHNQPVVTHGGVTGLVDGDKSTEQDIILSLERMRSIESVDVSGRTMTVQAGCILQSVHDAAKDVGLLYGLDLGARGSCTIGGNISTNAGGLSVLRYGMTRDQVLGLESVLADGTILSSMNAMIKNNAGYDLKQLFIGSEGTLGVVTRAVLKLRPDTTTVNTAIVAFDTFDQIKATLLHVSSALNAELNAFEIMWSDYYQLSTDPTIKGTRLISDAVIAKSETERSDIWQIRENVDLTLRHQPAFNFDISLPVNSMQTYLDQITGTLRALWSDVIVYAYGHMADSNLHITVVPVPENFIKNPDEPISRVQTSNETEALWYQQSNKVLFEPLAELGGSISAEHGIGLLKKQYLPYSRSAEEISTMQLLKRSLDPKNLLNPGKIV